MNAPANDLQAVLQRSRLPALDGLRAVAVAVVIAYHAGGPVPGDLGVSAFFVLSGFLITWLLLREYDRTARVDLTGFYLRRTLRIFPAYFVFIAVSFTLDTLLDHAWSWPQVTAAISYTVNYYNAFGNDPATSIAHAWSLAVEEQFYLLWPLGFLLLARWGRRSLAIGLMTVALGVVLWRSVAYSVLGFPPAYVYNAFDTRFDNLAVGCLLAVVAHSGWIERIARRSAAHPLLPFATLGLLLLSRMGGSPGYHYTAGFTVDALLVGIFIVQLLQLARHPLWSWLDHPAVRYLGLLSYPLYLYHQWGLGIGRRLDILPDAGRLAAGILAAVALAAGSYYAVERPFLAMKARLERMRAAIAEA